MGKVWLVTGAGSGLGAAIVKTALKTGDQVVATGRNLDKVRGAYDANLAFVAASYSLLGNFEKIAAEDLPGMTAANFQLRTVARLHKADARRWTGA